MLYTYFSRSKFFSNLHFKIKTLLTSKVSVQIKLAQSFFSVQFIAFLPNSHFGSRTYKDIFCPICRQIVSKISPFPTESMPFQQSIWRLWDHLDLETSCESKNRIWLASPIDCENSRKWGCCRPLKTIDGYGIEQIVDKTIWQCPVHMWHRKKR